MSTSVRCPLCRRIYLSPERLESCLDRPKRGLPSLTCGSCCGHGALSDPPIKDPSSMPLDWKEGSHILQQRGDKKIRLMNRLIQEEHLTIEEAFSRLPNE